MNFYRLCVTSALLLTVSACGTTGSTPVGPGELVNLTLQPVRVPPNAQGAFALSEVTGCNLEFVGRGPAEPIFQFRVRPTQRMPTVEACLASLKTQPGVEGVAVAR